MSWGDLLGGLANVLGGSAEPRGGGASRPAREPRVERIAASPPADEIAEADAETRRMMQEAARDMTRDFLDVEVEPWRKRIEVAESKVIDLDSNVASRLDRIESALDDVNFKALQAERLEVRVNVLIALVAVLLALTLWIGLRG